MSEQDDMVRTAIPTEHPSRILPVPRLRTILAAVVVLFLIYAFFSGLTKQFYASVVFSFYALTGSMWISVVLLGVFQTILLIPFRIISLLKSAHLKEFEDTVKTIAAEKEKAGFLKQSVKGGRRVALYYIVNFTVQLVSYVSIGRLFLTDFYSTKLDPKLLYDFVPYPDYPIQDRMYKLPYLWFSDTTDLGMQAVWIVWLIIIAIQVLSFLFRSFRKTEHNPSITNSSILTKTASFFAGSSIVLMILGYFVLRNFPVDWNLRLFRGDVAYVNPRFNLITALVTTFTLIWINIPRIRKKVELARAAQMDEGVIWQTQKDMFRDTLRNSSLLGLGAYFITNQIPSAFELSVFTLEVISLFSPLTLDRLILGTVKTGKVQANYTKQVESTISHAEESTKETEPDKPEPTTAAIDPTPPPLEKKRVEGEIRF